MPVQFYEKNNGIADLARTLVSAPALVQQSRRQAQDAAMQRRNDAAAMQSQIADARKSNTEADLLQDQYQRRQNLGQDLNTMDAYRSDRSMSVPPPAPGSARSPLEGDINQSLRGNQDLFASRETPGAEDYTSSLANVLRAFGGNAQQVTGAMGNIQSQNTAHQAQDVAQDTLSGSGLMAALNNIAAGNSMTPYSQNASGAVLDQYTGNLDESGQLAQANVMDTMQDQGTSLMQNAAAAGYQPGTPEYETFMRENVNTPLTQVNVGAEDMQTEQGKKLGQYLGETFIEIQEQAQEAANQNQQLDRIEQLLEGVQTGRGMPTLTEIQGLANTFGVELGDDLEQKEAAQSLTNQMALRFRSPESGMGLPGATSERDIAFLKSFPPGIGQSQEGRQLITETFRRINQRKQEVAQLTRDLVRQNAQNGVNGLTWEDVDAIQNAWAEPMFEDELIQTVQGLEGGASANQAGSPDQQQQQEAAQPQTQEEYEQLPSGALFIDPGDGKTYRKP